MFEWLWRLRETKWKGLLNTFYRGAGAFVGRDERQPRDPSDGVRPVRGGEKRKRRQERADWWSVDEGVEGRAWKEGLRVVRLGCG